MTYRGHALSRHKKLWTRFIYFSIVCLGLAPLTASAHTAQTALLNPGWLEGFKHPFSGFDHSLAMLAVGLISSRGNKTNPFLFPGIFLVFMSLGGILGAMGFTLPWSELGILLSVLSLGLILSVPKCLPTVVMISVLIIFACCHGHAHGHEMSDNVHPHCYFVGFLMATACLHALGYGLGRSLLSRSHTYFKWAGIGMAFSCLWL